jgi:hypothetical protein
VPVWLCVGDIATDAGRYESLGAPVYWIHGNNDNFDAIAAGDLPSDLHHIPNGTAVDVGRVFRPAMSTPFRPAMSLRVAGLGGTFAPTWYDTLAAHLPRGRTTVTSRSPEASRGTRRAPRDDKRRHFVREQVEACKALTGVDIFLTHEAAKPFRPFPGGRGPDAGKAQINDVLAVMQPRLHLFGHHHRYSEQVVEGVRSIGLDLAERSYVLIDAQTFEVTRRP